MIGRLSRADLLAHLDRESRGFREALAACAPDDRVPACPGWDASDLLWHLAEVQWFWSTVIRTVLERPPRIADTPTDPRRTTHC